MTAFSLEFSDFLKMWNIEYISRETCFFLPKYSFSVHLIGLPYIKATINSIETKEEPNTKKIIYIYEDLWRTKKEIITKRLLAKMSKANTIFARKCTIEPITSEQAKIFLDINHVLGYSKSKYKYGLLFNNQLVAVGCFSESRPMNRGGVSVDSYEWVRYASVLDYRVVGGMGKIFAHFCADYTPQEVMTYAAKDWSEGDVYKKLGFALIEETKPIKFYINKNTCERISEKKFIRMSINKGTEMDRESFFTLFDAGNLKFLWSRARV